MASEGGGKLRQKKSRASAKPYDRSKSLVGRLKDAVVNILNPSWVSGLVPWSEQSDENEEDLSEHDTRTLVSNKTSLNSISPVPHQSFIFPLPSLSSNDARPSRLLTKPKIPLDHPPYFRSNHDRESSTTNVAASSSSLAADVSPIVAESAGVAVAGPSTSTPLASSYSVALANAREFAAARRRRGGEEVEAKDANRVATVATTSASTSSSAKVFSKLSDFRKLSEGANSAEKRKSFHVLDHLTPNDSHSECSEESMSTSGCSSMVPHPDKREYQREVLQLEKSRLNPIDEDLPENPVTSFNESRTWGLGSDLTDRRTKSLLWPESTRSSRQLTRPQPTASSSRPQFNPSLLGTSLWSEQRNSTGNNSRADSPYLGKVTYGFGSSVKRPRSSMSTPYDMESSYRNLVKAKVPRMSDEDVMSSTAKRILLTLEKMSTPLSDAKKIPTKSSLSPILETPLNFNPTARRRPNLSNRRPADSLLYAGRMSAPPTDRILTPSSVNVRNISKSSNREVFHIQNEASSSEMTFRPNVRLSEPVTATPSLPASKLDSRGGGKIRARPEPLHYSSTSSKDEVVEIPNLPLAPLPIQNLPIFDLIPLSGSTFKPVAVNKYKEATAVDPKLNITPKVNAVTSISQPSVPSVPMFTFSTPVVKQDIGSVNGNASSPVTPPSLPNYTFHSPAAEEMNTPKSKVDNAKGFVSSSSVTRPLKKRPDSEKPKDDPPNSSLRVASELKAGSVMDILGKSTTSPNATNDKRIPVDSSSLANRFRPPEGSWSCSTCMISNNADAVKCIACESVKPAPKSSTVSSETALPVSAFSSTSTSTTSTPQTTPSYSWGDKFRATADTWECPTCMLRVASSSDKCMACETQKPNTIASKPKSSVSEGMWECDICMVRNANSASKCIACESLKPKPVQSSASNFKFGFTMPPASTAVTTGSSFKFGSTLTSTPSVTTTTGGFKFGFNAADTTNTTKDQPNANNAFKITLKANDEISAPVITSSSVAVTSTTGTSSTTSAPTLTTATGGFKFGFQPPSAANNTVTSTTARVSSSTSAAVELQETKTDSLVTSSTSVKTLVSSAAPFSFLPPSAASSSATFTTSTSTVPVTKSDFTPISFVSKPITNTSAADTAAAVTTASGGFSFTFNPLSQTSAKTTTTAATPASAFTFGGTPTTTAAETNISVASNSFVSQASTAVSGGKVVFSFGGGTQPVTTVASSDTDPNPLKKPAFGSFAAPTKSGSSLSFKPSVAPAPVFGALSTVSDKTPASSTFTFGTAASVVTSTPIFGSTDSIKISTPTFGTASVTSVPPLNFSAPSAAVAASAPPAFGAAASAVAPPNTGGNQTFMFGTSTPASTVSNRSTLANNVFNTAVTTAPSFGSITASTPTFGSFGASQTGLVPPTAAAVAPGVVNPNNQTSGFSFGTTASAPAATPSVPSAFTFGGNQSTAAPNSSVFSFTGNQQQTATQPSSSFNFGATPLQPPTGFNFNPTQPLNLNFGGSGAPPNQAYEFSANPFDAHQASSRIRQIRKAKRRNK